MNDKVIEKNKNIKILKGKIDNLDKKPVDELPIANKGGGSGGGGGGSGGGSNSSQKPKPKQEGIKIEIEPNELEMTMGNVKVLKAIITPEDTTNKDIIWSTSDENIATVKKGVLKRQGNVSAKGLGTAVITATSVPDNTKSATCEVTVVRSETSYVLIIDGVSEEIETDIALPYIDDTLWVSIRFFAEHLGARVDWYNDEKKAVIMKDDIQIELTLDNDLVIIAGRTMADLKYVSNKLGYTLTWDLDKNILIFETID